VNYLEQCLERATIHVFDVDHTLTRHSTGRRFAQAGIRLGEFHIRDFLTMPWFYLRYRMGSLKLTDITREIQVISGMRRDRIREIAAAAWRDFVEDDLFSAAREHLRTCQARGHRTLLLSTSFDLILEPVAAALEVDTVLASELEFEGDRATGWIVGGPCYAEEKARRLSEYLTAEGRSPEECAFYSDSFHDMPSFELVGTPVPVNPDSVLRVAARGQGWPITKWT
jgi:HAD superfamily hydrolase (TIGR01490 family)